MRMSETKAQRQAREAAQVDKAIAPHFAAWVNDLRTNGLDRAYPMPPINEEMMISSAFGNRSGGQVQGGVATKTHRAVDLVTKVSSDGRDVPIHAVVAGRVLYVGVPSEESGVSVLVGGVDGKIYSYAHLETGSTKNIKPGQQLDRGETLGLMGRTGATSGKCVHVVERLFKFEADGKPGSTFDDWSWQKSKSTGNSHVPPREVGAAIEAFERDSGHAMKFRDLQQTPPRVLWEKDPKKLTVFRGAMAADINPHMFNSLRTLRDAMPEGSPMHFALDATIRTGNQPLRPSHTPPRAVAALKPPAPPKAEPKEESSWSLASISTSIGSLLSSACEAASICATPAQAKPSAKGRH